MNQKSITKITTNIR